MDYLQIIPLLALMGYFLYLTYYYAGPMFWLKVLLFIAHTRHRGIDIRFIRGKITIRLPEEEHVIEQPLEIDPTSRFFAMTVCSEFRKMLRNIRKKDFISAAEENEYDGLSTGKRTGREGRQRIEEDCDRNGVRDADITACSDMYIQVNTEGEQNI